MPDQSTGVCAARTNALVCNIHELVTELEERIEDGEPFDNPKLTRTAERIFGGTRAQGKYTPRDAYDAVEIAVNNYLLEKHAKQLMQMDVTDALASVLRPLMQRLPRQTDRTQEQNELQQFSTPPTLAYVAARLLNPTPDDVVLEPSAGTGSLAIGLAQLERRLSVMRPACGDSRCSNAFSTSRPYRLTPSSLTTCYPQRFNQPPS